MESPSRYGRACARNADPPAKPAAATNGSTGRQQLEAASTLPTAATLANQTPVVFGEPSLGGLPRRSSCRRIVSNRLSEMRGRRFRLLHASRRRLRDRTESLRPPVPAHGLWLRLSPYTGLVDTGVVESSAQIHGNV